MLHYHVLLYCDMLYYDAYYYSTASCYVSRWIAYSDVSYCIAYYDVSYYIERHRASAREELDRSGPRPLCCKDREFRDVVFEDVEFERKSQATLLLTTITIIVLVLW